MWCEGEKFKDRMSVLVQASIDFILETLRVIEQFMSSKTL